MNTYVGKIGRLPKTIRDELGQRIENGASGVDLINWLNRQPAVQAAMTRYFEGRPITEKNLSDWRQTGHQHWLQRQDMKWRASQLMEQAQELGELATVHELADQFASLLAMEMMKVAETLIQEETDPKKRWAILCQVNRELSQLRRDDHRAAKKKLDQDKWEQAQAEKRREEAKQKQAAELQVKLAPYEAKRELRRVAFDFGIGEVGREAAANMLAIKYNLPVDNLRDPNAGIKTPNPEPKTEAAAHGY